MNSLFGGSQLLLIKNPWFLSKAPADRDIDMIKTIVSLLPQTDHIMVIYTLGAVDQRKKMASFLKKNSIFQQHSYFKEWEQDNVLAWISNAVKMRGKTIDQDALIALEQVGGTQLQRLSNELDMLCLYRSDRSHLTLDDVKAMSADISTNTFNLIEALKGGNTSDIICCMTQLLRSGEDPIRLMGLIVSQIQLFVQLLQLHQRKVSSQDIAKSVGKNPYYIQKLIPQLAKKYTLDTASQLLINLATADYEIKSGKKKPEAALKVAIMGRAT
jgi:DNA polymerase-3 subunit delta